MFRIISISKEALNFEAEYKRTAKADMDMTMGELPENNTESDDSIVQSCEEYLQSGR